MCENYLLSNHREDILQILADIDKDKYFSVNINFLELFESDTNLGNALLSDPENSLKIWNESIFNVQNQLRTGDETYTLKNNVSCRIYSLPPWPHVSRTVFPGNDDVEKFLQITGTVVRMSVRKLLEYQRQYICTRCKFPITVEAKYDKRHIIKQPKKCPNPEGCVGKNIITFGELDPYNCKDYQEIKIQEDPSQTQIGVGTVPGHMLVTLEDDLVNSCKPGENVTITGIVKRRWSEFDKGTKITVEIVLKANHIQINNSSGLTLAVSNDMKLFFETFWNKYRHDPLVGRNIILKSISPEIYGRHLVKLAIAIVLAGGSPNEQAQISTGIDTRAESHLLLVGDPGTGKSQMLKFASKIIPRSVLTTGIGSTAAGLTVTALMENGEWQLEAGALVMADGGICCIDEFNSMREHDRTSIHEAMEQQTISVAKAGIVCKLKTRCSILAACNPKGNIDPSQPLCVNVAMSSPLLSRFDLVLLLRDIVNEENDRILAEHLLSKTCELSGDEILWSMEKLQAYYAVIKKQSPKLTADAETILSTYYQLQRKFGSRNKSRTTVRLLESLIRLSQGHAKLICHSEVQVIDTVFAVILVDAALDFESSLFNLNIDKINFFDNPYQTYWELLEVILQKLNLDYIYQREIDKNRGQRVENTKIDDGSSKEVSKFFSHSAGSGTLGGSQLMFGQRRRSEQNEEQKTTKNRTFLFSQKSQNTNNNNNNQLTEKHIKTILDKRNSEQIGKSHDDSFQHSGSQLLFSQRRFGQKEKEIRETSSQINVNVKSSCHDDSGICSNQEVSNILSQNTINNTKDDIFNIHLNKKDNFIRKRTTLNLNSDLCPGNAKSDENLKQNSVQSGSKRTGMKLSDIVKSNSCIDLDFNFVNMKTHRSKLVGKNSTAKIKKFKSSENCEESGFVSQNTSSEKSADSTLEETVGGPSKKKTKLTDEAEQDPKRTFSSMSRVGSLNKNKVVNELDLLKLMPSVNDDLMSINWDLSDGTENINKCDIEENISNNSKGLNSAVKEASVTQSDSDGSCSDNIANHRNQNGSETNSNFTESKQFEKNKEVPKARKSFLNLLSKFEYVPREKTEKDGKSDNETKLQKVIKEDEINKDSINPGTSKILNLETRSVLNKPSFLKNSFEKNPGNGTKCDTSLSNINLERKKDMKFNFKRLSANFNLGDLDEDFRSFELENNFRNPFERMKSNFGSVSSSSE